MAVRFGEIELVLLYSCMVTLTEKQFNALTGSLLGDGYLRRPRQQNWNSCFEKTQKAGAKEYLYDLYCVLNPYSRSMARRIRTKGLAYFVLRTSCNAYFTELRKKWYPCGVKVVPKDLSLNPEILAWWFCDDGTNTWRSRIATIYTQGFTIRDNEMLVSKLKDIGISARVGDTYDGSGNGCCLDISGPSYCDLLEMIRPHVRWKCMEYKVDTHGAKKGLRRGNKSGVNGVYWSESRKRWCACIKKDCKSIALGRFLTIEEAIHARREGEKKYSYSGMGRTIYV